jgi:hypothetical protein
MRNVYKIWSQSLNERKHLEGLDTERDNIKVNVRDIGCDVGCMHLDQDSAHLLTQQ